MSLEDSDTEGACSSDFNECSSDRGSKTRSTYLKLPSRVLIKSESSSSESDLDVRKPLLRLPFPSRRSYKTNESESSQSKSDMEDDYFPPYEFRERVCKKSSMHMELYSTPPAQVAAVIQSCVSERVEILKSDENENAICQAHCVPCEYNNDVLKTLLEEIRLSYNTEDTDEVMLINTDSKDALEHSQLQLKRLQIKKELKRIEYLDGLLTREKEKSIRENYKFEKEMFLLNAEITKTLNKSIAANSNSTS